MSQTKKTTTDAAPLVVEEPMGDLIQLPTGSYQLVPFAGMTAAKAAALVSKSIG